MKKIIPAILSLFAATASFAQQGLENIIVEKYYISDTADARSPGGGFLPPGSVTWRIYVDMLPDYKFHAAYGVPGHDLIISTSTSFFNNESYGSAAANEISASTLPHNTVMLDSWLSVGAASSGHFGIPKSNDNEKYTILNSDGILKSQNPLAGIPLTSCDGLLKAFPQLAVTFYAIDSAMLQLFGNKNSPLIGQTFFTANGSWASFGGAAGPDSSNKVLIAQLTTDGDLHFELNIQIGKGQDIIQNYVARNPVDNEIHFPVLIFNSNPASQPKN